ncbi:ispH [Symbiodinium natans]|uniref:IspH protein n=1 Tax=Symbiodinium natans TaxID=878477 RepID=A0A812UQE3_9DINO|nr:ispH [Symbiodinium natans]
MASRSTLTCLLLRAFLLSRAQRCDEGDAACAARSSALLQHSARQMPSGESTYGGGESLYGGSSLPPICKDSADFMPEKEMWAYCDMYSAGVVVPPADVCNAQTGCYGDQGWCHCEKKEGCVAVGGTWIAQTCAMEMDTFSPEQIDALRLADVNGTCVDIYAQGMAVADFAGWTAQSCCQSFPASVCNKTLLPQTPCLHDEDFEHNKTQWAWCNLYPTPTEHDCKAQGCEGSEWHCHCEEEESCVALGGQWSEYQCWQDLKWMAATVHEGIAKAKHQHSCDDIEVYHSKLEYQVEWLGKSCCSSGMSVCEEL